MTSLIGQLVTQTVVNSSPDAIFDVFAHKPYELVTAAPDIFQSLDLLDGLWGTLGCLFTSKYVDGGIIKTANVLVVAIDEINKSITYQLVAGDLLDLYTAISVTFQATTQGGTNIVTWTMNYVKLLPISPDPTSLMNLAVAATKEVDAQIPK